VIEAAPVGPAAALGLDWKLFLAQLVNFGLLVFILSRFAFKPLIAAMKARRKEIEEGISNAERAKKSLADADREVKALETKAHREARDIVDASRLDAERVRAELLVQAKAEAEREQTQAKERIASERDAMMRSLRGELAGLVVLATEKVAGEHLPESSRRSLAEEAVNGLER